MEKIIVILAVLLFTSTAWSQGNPKKYPWQWKDTPCTENMTFCWYGSDLVVDPEVTAHGTRWVSDDKTEKPFEWITEVRCIKALRVCILARNQRVLSSDWTMTNIDLYYVQEWSEHQIRAVGETDLPKGKECEIDSLLLNRDEGSVSMLSVPGPAATTKGCEGIMKPKTVLYKLLLSVSQPTEPPKP